MLKSFQQEYKQQFPENDWKTDLKAAEVSVYKLPLLYSIALFNCMVFDLPENDELYAKADSLYQLP